MLIIRDAGDGGYIEGGALAGEVVEPAGYGDHGGVVGGELELREIGVPAALFALLLDAGAQTAVGRDSPADGHFLDTGLPRGLDQLVHQDVYQRLLETGADVLLVLLHEVRILRHLVTDEIKQRSLHTAEAVVKPRNLRLGELEAGRIAELRQPVDHRTARVAEPHHLGALVESLPDSVIDRLAENLVVQRAVHLDNLRVAS